MAVLRPKQLAASLAVFGLLLSACGGAASPTPTAASDMTFIYVSPNLIAQDAFNTMGQTGTEAAAAKHGATAKTYESTDPASRESNVDAAIAEDPTIIVLLGFEFNDIVTEVAPDNPDIDFLIVDTCIENPPPNVSCAMFREQEASFLAGVAAGLMSKTGQVGNVTALDIPFMHRYADPVLAGAAYAKPGTTGKTVYVGGDKPYSDPARGKEQALSLIADGIDVIFASAGGSDAGTFEAATEEGVFAIGNNANFCPDHEGVVIDNVLKRVDTAIDLAVDAILADAESHIVTYGLAEGGMSVSSLEPDASTSKCLVADEPEVVAALEAAKAGIIDGTITVEDPLAAQ